MIKKIKTSASFITEFKREYVREEVNGKTKVPSAQMLADDWGIRIRKNKPARQFGLDVYEISGSYFYRSQQDCTRLFRDLVEFGVKNGWTVRQIRWEEPLRNPVILDMLAPADLTYCTARWPHNRWAVAYVQITKSG